MARPAYRSRYFARFTPSSKVALFNAACSAYLRGAEHIEPRDLLVGLAELRHQETCGFRRLYEQREAIAQNVQLPALPCDAKKKLLATENRPPLDSASWAMIAMSAQIASEQHQFWIDNDHLQLALQRSAPELDQVLQSAGYPQDVTAHIGRTSRAKVKPKPPTLKQRLQALPQFANVLIGVAGGAILAFVFALLRAVLQ